MLYLNDIEFIFNNNDQPASFSKILLSGNPGDVLFNTFVPFSNSLYSKNFPISSLTNIQIKITYPDGSKVNFRNIEHSLTLEIIEEHVQNNNTNLNSNLISVSTEFKNKFIQS